MDYRSARDTAEQWGISERLVQRLCAEGRIAGARKISGSWAIPLDAQKPDDMRKRLTREKIVAEILAQASGAEQAHGVDDEAPTAADTPASDTTAAGAPSPDRTSDDANVFANLMPLMNSPFKPGKCRETIERLTDPDIHTVAQAEYCYFSGDAEEAARITEDLLSHRNLSVRLSACLIYVYANLPLGNINRARFALAELRNALSNIPEANSSQSKAAMAFTGYASSVLLHLPMPNDAPPVDSLLPLLPRGLRAFALYVISHQLYLRGEYAKSLGMAETALMINSETYPIPEIYLHLIAVMDCMSLKRTDEARKHLLAAWELARPDGLIEAFGEHHGLLGGMLESVIKKDWPEDFKRIIDITYRFSAGWRRVHNPATEEKVADNLSTTEFTVSMLAARGWTNQEIGTHLEISANTVKSYLASSFRKLGISKRQELGKYMLR